MHNDKHPTTNWHKGQGVILLFLFTVSMAEIALFMIMGDILGFWGTLLAVFITAWAGAKLVKAQGINTLISAQNTLNQGKTPLREVYAGICLLLAGALLVTPGFLTDGVGILLMFPWFRDAVGVYLMTKLLNSPNVQMRFSQQGFSSGFGAGFSNAPPTDDGVIDGDFTEQKPKKNTKTLK